MPENFRFNSKTEEALGNYILECGKQNDIEHLSFTHKSQIAILLYDDGLVFSIDQTTGKILIHDSGVSNDSDWKNPVDMANFLQDYVEDCRS